MSDKININNNIDKNVKVNIYFNNKFLGTCENELAFLDVRCQIKEQAIDGYEFEYQGKRYKIDKFGELEEYPDGMWSSHIDLLCKLVK